MRSNYAAGTALNYFEQAEQTSVTALQTFSTCSFGDRSLVARTPRPLTWGGGRGSLSRDPPNVHGERWGLEGCTRVCRTR